MIYEILDTLPIKTFYKIQETRQFSLLNNYTENEPTEELFNRVFDEFISLSDADNINNDFFVRREISHLEGIKKVCSLGVEILKYRNDSEIRSNVSELLRIPIRTNVQSYYYKDLERCEKKINLLSDDIFKLSERLTKTDDNSIKSEFSINDTLASISSILGISFDFNTIPCNTYIAYKKQTQSKIKAQEEQLQKFNIK